MTPLTLISWFPLSSRLEARPEERPHLWWRIVTMITVAFLLALIHSPARTAEATTPQGQRPKSLVKVADGRLLAPDIARIVNSGELVVAMLKEDAAEEG